ncbi:MAG: PaaI family thioesterase [Nevskia sp.]|nr:PaaI family thioesterase [Nevskia sp.]
MSAALLELGRQVLATQGFSRLLGTELSAWDERGVRLELAIDDRLSQQNGYVHGGVLAYLADNALTYAGGGALGAAVLTAEIKINYLRPARGTRLIAQGTVLHAGRTQAVCRCEIYARHEGEDRLCAAAQGTIVRAPAPVVSNTRKTDNQD